MSISTEQATAMKRGPNLGALFAQFDEYMSFSPEEWALAAAARHRAVLDEIQELCTLSPSDMQDKRLMQGRINRVAELSSAADIDLDVDIAWMTDRRAELARKAHKNTGDAGRQQAAS